MGLSDFVKRLVGGGQDSRPGLGLDELARRLGLPVEELKSLQRAYSEFQIPKRSGGTRTISVPDPELKKLQRAVLWRLLRRLKAHPAAHGFERGRSVVTNARPHVKQEVVLRMDIRDFFGSTTDARVKKYFRGIGWSRDAADWLTWLCTWKGALPQGAPTSPRLSNLVNYKLDARLAAAAKHFGANYTRYADDLTFSFPESCERKDVCRSPRTGRPVRPHSTQQRTLQIIQLVQLILEEEGYLLHTKKKLHVRRRHQQQKVTGIVVNDKLNLPRAVRRRLRAVEHHLAVGKTATLTPAQLAGWRAYAASISAGPAERT